MLSVRQDAMFGAGHAKWGPLDPSILVLRPRPGALTFARAWRAWLLAEAVAASTARGAAGGAARRALAARGPLLRACATVLEAAEHDKQLHKALQSEARWAALSATVPPLHEALVSGKLGPPPPMRPGEEAAAAAMAAGSAEDARLLAMLQGMGVGGPT